MKEIKEELQRRFEQRRTFKRHTWASLIIKVIALLAIILVFKHFVEYREISLKNIFNSQNYNQNEIER